MKHRNFNFGSLNLDKKSVLITGGTGSFGKALVKKLLNDFNPERIIVFSRDEQKQFQMSYEFETNKYSNLRYLIGDVRDLDRLEMATFGVDYIFHGAAMKHVEASEYNAFECIKTNVNGAENIVKASLKNNVKKIIALSTDKACNPINLYGASKLASDKIFVAANNLVGKRKTKFSVVRYGNVIGSNGSVIPLFKNILKSGGKYIPITDTRMTRFIITLDQGTSFVLSSLSKMNGGEIFIPKIPSVKIIDIAKAIAPNLPIKEIGKRSGEKLHEMMITEEDSDLTFDLDDFYVIQPNIKFWDFKKPTKNKYKKVNETFSYSSLNNDEWLDNESLKKLLEL